MNGAAGPRNGAAHMWQRRDAGSRWSHVRQFR